MSHNFCDDFLLAGLKLDSVELVSDWADANRVLSQTASSEPGRFRTSRTPYLKEIMDALSSSSSYEKIVFMKGAQIGGTELVTTGLVMLLTGHRGRCLLCSLPSRWENAGVRGDWLLLLMTRLV